MSTESVRKAVWTLKAANFASVFDRYSIAAILVVIGSGFDVTIGHVTLAASGYFLAYGVMQPAWSLVSDRLGVVMTMRIAATVGSLATLAAALAPSIELLIGARIVGGAFMGALVPTALIYAGELFADDVRQRGLAGLMTSNALGTTLATAVSGVIAVSFGWRWVFALSVAFAALAAILLFRLANPAPKARGHGLLGPLRLVIRNRYALCLFALVSLEGAGILGAVTFIPTALSQTGLDAAAAAAPAILFGATVFAVAPLIGRLSTRTRASTLIAAGGLIGVVGAAMMTRGHTVAAAALCAALLGAAWALSHSSLQTWATQIMPEHRAAVVALFATSLFAGNAAAATIGGWFSDNTALQRHYLVCAIALSVIGILGSWTRRRWEDRSTGSDAGR